MGPWPLLYNYTSLFLGTKCDISFIVVGPETYKLLNKIGTKMWKAIKGHYSKSYGPLAPILLPHLLFFRDHVWYKFHGSRTTNITSIKQNVKSRNDRMTEGHGKSNIAPLFHSGAKTTNFILKQKFWVGVWYPGSWYLHPQPKKEVGKKNMDHTQKFLHCFFFFKNCDSTYKFYL